jgi:tRNA 2-selenouridine synthase
MIKPISINDLWLIDEQVALLDVRTPAEFEHGHIPGAFNLPLFTNEERVLVGTMYKQVGREEAILLGFDLTGTKWSGFIKSALAISPDKKVCVHCWRGGMRSGAMAWVLDLYGFEVYVIQGGYKKYRNWVLRKFEERYRLVLLGGMTGSGKTKTLQQLKIAGEQVIDLEDLAQHQGSSYGTMNKMIQPTQEQFENNFAASLKALDPSLKIWVEDESLSIGKLFIPKPFWEQMRQAILIELKVDMERRITSLLLEYGSLDKDFLIECTDRIRKRLGPEQTKHAILAIEENRMEDFIRQVLFYYDKAYLKMLEKRSADTIFSFEIKNTADVSGILTFLHAIPQPKQSALS